MVIYSVWRPDGGYDYYEDRREVAALGNDLPIPDLKIAGVVGVPSIEAGRPVPPGARHVGTGPLARGLIAPTNMSRLGFAIGSGERADARLVWFALGALTIGAAWAWSHYRRRRS
jgi:hypothetical protein